MDAGEIDLGAEGRAGQHRELVRGIDAVDVEARIGLGVARGLRLGQHDVEVAPGLAHRRQDVVAGAVEDAVEALHAVADQALAQRLDDRDAARDRRLEGEDALPLLGRRRELGAVQRQQRLVGGDDVLARGAARFCTSRRATPPEPPISSTTTSMSGAVASASGSFSQRTPVRSMSRFLALRAGADRHELERPAAAQRQQPAVLGQQLDDASAHGAEAGDADPER